MHESPKSAVLAHSDVVCTCDQILLYTGLTEGNQQSRSTEIWCSQVSAQAEHKKLLQDPYADVLKTPKTHPTLRREP